MGGEEITHNLEHFENPSIYFGVFVWHLYKQLMLEETKSIRKSLWLQEECCEKYWHQQNKTAILPLPLAHSPSFCSREVATCGSALTCVTLREREMRKRERESREWKGTKYVRVSLCVWVCWCSQSWLYNIITPLQQPKIHKGYVHIYIHTYTVYTHIGYT